MRTGHVEMMIRWFKFHGGYATLRKILSSGEPWSREFNARKSDLRRKTMYDLVLARGLNASDNVYSLIEKPMVQPEFLKVSNA